MPGDTQKIGGALAFPAGLKMLGEIRCRAIKGRISCRNSSELRSALGF